MRVRAYISNNPCQMPVFKQVKLYFNISTLIFSKFLHVKNQIYPWNIQKNYHINFCDNEGHNRGHTRYQEMTND